MVDDTADCIQRWTANRRVALVVSILKGETPVADAATASLMKEFYLAMKPKLKEFRRALRRAKLRLLDNER